MPRTPLQLSHEWLMEVSRATEYSVEHLEPYIQTLWRGGWTIVQIQNRLIQLASAKGKILIFTPEGQPS
jgi:hypothetical protein